MKAWVAGGCTVALLATVAITAYDRWPPPVLPGKPQLATGTDARTPAENTGPTPAQAESQASVSSQDLRLVATVVSRNPTDSRAVIRNASDGVARKYAIGEPVGPDLTLTAVEHDWVKLKRTLAPDSNPLMLYIAYESSDSVPPQSWQRLREAQAAQQKRTADSRRPFSGHVVTGVFALPAKPDAGQPPVWSRHEDVPADPAAAGAPASDEIDLAQDEENQFSDFELSFDTLR